MAVCFIRICLRSTTSGLIYKYINLLTGVKKLGEKYLIISLLDSICTHTQVSIQHTLQTQHTCSNWPETVDFS